MATPGARRASDSALSGGFVIIWSSGYLAGDLALRHMGPYTLLAWRFVLATLLFTALALIARVPWPRGRRAWLRVAATGFFLQPVQFFGGYTALAHGTSAAMTSLVVCTAPLLVAAVGVAAFGERLGPLQWVGFVLGFGGVAVAVSGNLHAGGGVLWTLLGLAGITVGTVLQKRFGGGYDPRAANAIQFAVGAVVTLPFAAVEGQLGVSPTLPALAPLAWCVVVNSVLGTVMLFVLLRRRPSGEATSLLFLVPPVTALLGVVLLGEPLDAASVVGLALAVAGVGLVVRPRTRNAGPVGETSPTEPAFAIPAPRVSPLTPPTLPREASRR